MSTKVKIGGLDQSGAPDQFSSVTVAFQGLRYVYAPPQTTGYRIYVKVSHSPFVAPVSPSYAYTTDEQKERATKLLNLNGGGQPNPGLLYMRDAQWYAESSQPGGFFSDLGPGYLERVTPERGDELEEERLAQMDAGRYHGQKHSRRVFFYNSQGYSSNDGMEFATIQQETFSGITAVSQDLSMFVPQVDEFLVRCDFGSGWSERPRGGGSNYRSATLLVSDAGPFEVDAPAGATKVTEAASGFPPRSRSYWRVDQDWPGTGNVRIVRLTRRPGWSPDGSDYDYADSSAELRQRMKMLVNALDPSDPSTANPTTAEHFADVEVEVYSLAGGLDAEYPYKPGGISIGTGLRATQRF